MTVNRLTIVTSNGLVIVNDDALNLIDDRLNQMMTDGIHAVQWLDGAGHVEYTNGQSNMELKKS